MLSRVFRSFSEKETKQPQTIKPTPKLEHKKPDTQSQLLPDSISSRILDLEMQCQKQTISKQIVFELIAQYTRAIQFYEEKGNNKYKLYQKRMHNFLARPMVEEILKGKSGQMVMKKEKKQETIRKAEVKVQQQAKQLMKKQEQMRKKHQKIIKQEISKQEGALEQRMRTRRAVSNKSIVNSSFHTDLDDNNVNNAESGKKSKIEGNNEQIMDMKDFLTNLGERKRKNQKFYL